MPRKHCILFIIILISKLLIAQNELHFSHLGTEFGFTIDKANTIVQDQQGFIWVGTWNGLNCFDGYNCVTYQPEYHDSTSISNREITKLLVDKAGNLWIGTPSGLNFMNLQSGELKRYDIRNRIMSLCEDHEGNIWVGTWTNGLFKLIPQTGQMTHYLENEVISDIFEDSRSILWIASYNGLLKFDRENNLFKRYLPETGRESLPNPTITQIIESKDGDLWIGSWGRGLTRAKVNDKGEISDFAVYMDDSNGENSINDNVVYRLFYDQFNNLWIGSWNAGLSLLKYDQQQQPPEEARFWRYKVVQNNPGGLSGNGIASIFVDRSGLLWVGATKIDKASITDNGLSRYVLPSRVDNSNNQIYIKSFAAYKNQLWVGTSYNLLQYEKVNGIYTLKKDYGEQVYSYNNRQFTAYTILDMYADSTGLWLGTEDAGIIHYKYHSDYTLNEKSRLSLNSITEPSLPGNKISALFPSKKYPGVVWVGINEWGLAKMTISPDGSIQIGEFASGSGENTLSNSIIRAINEDSKGSVWIGTENGLNCFNQENDCFKKFFSSPTDTTTLNDDAINAILEDSFGNVWVGTNSGLNKVVTTPQNDGTNLIQFKGYPEIDYLRNEFISSLMEDKSGNLWIRTYRGMLKFDIQNERLSGEYFSQDYQNDRLERNAELVLADGRLAVANLTSFTISTPDVKNDFSRPVDVIMTDVLIYDKSLNSDKELRHHYGIESTIPFADHINLSFRDKMITFNFSAMDYQNPGKNIYYYKLDRFDNQWNEIKNRNFATYTNIPPGSYTFKVKAVNSHGIESDHITSFTVLMSPPWYRSTLAYLIYTLIILLVLYLLSKYSIMREQEKNKLEFERLKADEMVRLDEQKSLFFTDITHELRTPLTLILGPSRELLEDKSLKPSSRKLVGLINSSAIKLLRLVNQLMEFRRIEKGVSDKLYIQKCEVNSLLEEVYSFFKPMADSRKISFTMELCRENIHAYFDPDKFEKIVFNLISNAFKYSPDHGTIHLKADTKTLDEHKSVLIEVEDSGVGIAKEYQEKVFERFFQVNQVRTQSTGGIGLFMAKALVEQHGGTIELDSEPGKGSCFRIILPIDQNLLELNDSTDITSGKSDTEVIETDLLTDSTEDTDGVKKDTHKLQVLIIEDDAELNEFLVSGLSESFKIHKAYNGKEALEKLKTINPDLILSDIMMPEMDGYEFLQNLRKNINLSHIPLIFLTAKTMQEERIKGLKMGAVDYINKPFNLVSLRLKIRNLLATQTQMKERLRTEQILEPEHIELSSLDEDFLKNAVEAVNKNLDNNDYDIEAFSADLKMSSNQLYRKIKALTGQTANEFIRNQRLKVASDLLLQQKRSISEVIYMVGFTSPSYFSRCFKEFYGCSPKEYIAKNS